MARRQAEQALAVPVEPASGLAPSGFGPSRLDAWLDEPGQCRPCHGPIVPKTKLGMIRDYACFVAVMWWPDRFFLTAPHRWLLGHAGSHAYTCGCWHKIATGPHAQP